MAETPPAIEDLITVGRVVSVFGVKGWVKIRTSANPYDRLLEYSPLWLAGGGESDRSSVLQPIELDEGRVQGEGLVAHLKGVDDRDQARLYCQRDILVRKAVLPILEEGEFYWHQLEGLQVFSSFDGALRLLGTVSRMMETGANDVMVVSPCEGSIDSRERLLPYLPDHYNTRIDLQASRLTMDWDPEF